GHRVVVYGHGGGAWSIQREAVVLAAARAAGARTVLHLHSPTLIGVLRHAAGRAWLRGVARSTDAICVLTPFWERQVREAGLRGRVEVVPNPLPPDAERAARRGPSPERHADATTSVLVMT